MNCKKLLEMILLMGLEMYICKMSQLHWFKPHQSLARALT